MIDDRSVCTRSSTYKFKLASPSCTISSSVENTSSDINKSDTIYKQLPLRNPYFMTNTAPIEFEIHFVD